MSATSSSADLDDPPAAIDDADAAAAESQPTPSIPRHPLLAAAVLGLAALSFATYGVEARAFIYAFAAGVLTVLAVIDIQHRVLPNRILLPATAIVLGAQLAFYPGHWMEWLLAGLAAAAFLALPLIFRRDAMGMGDIKLAVLLGAIVGWDVFGAIIIGCIAMLPFALQMRLNQGSLRGATLPFGPFLALGTVLVMMLGGS